MAMKEAREREHDAYMRSLTPEEIKRENLFRAAQRKAGKSRKSNIMDPNAPKKPLSAFLCSCSGSVLVPIYSLMFLATKRRLPNRVY